MQAPLPLPSGFERTERLKALEKWREEVNGRMNEMGRKSDNLRCQYEKLYNAYRDNSKVREACKETVANLRDTMQREIAKLKEEIDQMKGVVDDDDVRYVKTVPPVPPGLRLKL